MQPAIVSGIETNRTHTKVNAPNIRSSDKSELPRQIKIIWSKDLTKLGSNRCVQISHEDV